MLRDRIRFKPLLDKLVSAEEAAAYIQDGMTVGADPDAARVADVQRHSGIAGELRGHNERLQRRCSCRRAYRCRL